MGILAQHHTQTGIFSSDKSRRGQELPALDCQQNVGRSGAIPAAGILPCGVPAVELQWAELPTTHGRAPADPDGKWVLEMELYLLKQATAKGQEGHQQLPPIQQASLLG